MIRFVFSERKAAQAAAYLLKLNGGRMPYLKLIKLLYLADRESLLKTGLPITGDRFVSMDRGPVLSRVYNLISEEPQDLQRPWFEYIKPPQDYAVSLANESPEFDDLSPFETKLLESLFQTYKDTDRFALADLTHEICPEWKDPQGSSIPIDPAEVLQVAGKSQEEIERVTRDALELQVLARIACSDC